MALDRDSILGLDGGGTKTLMALTNRDGAVELLTSGPTVDPFAHPAWPDELRTMISRVAPWRDRLAEAVLGLPCYDEVASLSLEQRQAVQRCLTVPHQVINDVEAAFDGALAGAPGVLLLAGTGSMAWAGDGDASIRAGGWGEWFGDEGSAYWIGREALGEASRAIDGRSQNLAFSERLLDLSGLEPDTLLDWCLNRPARRTAVAALAFDVDTLAESGEPTARDILRRAGDALAVHAEACARRLQLPARFTWTHAGSVFNSRTVMQRVVERLGSEPRRPRLPPVGGALLRAAKRAGWQICDGWIEGLDRALRDYTSSDETVRKGDVQ